MVGGLLCYESRDGIVRRPARVDSMGRVVEQHVGPGVNRLVFALCSEDSGVGDWGAKQEGCAGEERWVGEFIRAGQGEMA